MAVKSPHRLRSESNRLAPADWSRAAAVAREIADPWHAAQSFAWAARYAPEERVGEMIERSFGMAREGKDAYRQLAATAWPLRALVERGRTDAAAAFAEVSPLAARVWPPSSRAEACGLVFQALAVGPADLANRALAWHLKHAQPATHWRQRRAVRDAVLMAVTLGLVEADAAPRLIRDEPLAAEVARRLAAGGRYEPRTFYWPRGH